MAVYVRYAHKAEKLELPLATERDRIEVATRIVAVTILNKGAGNFTLTFHFYDGTELTLDQDDVLNGDVFQWNVEGLRLTNTAQAGLTLKLLVDVQLEGEKTLAVV